MSENEERLISENEALKAALEQLLVRVADLEARLKQNSGNSSKPPDFRTRAHFGGSPRPICNT